MKRMRWFFLSNLALILLLVVAYHFIGADIHQSALGFFEVLVAVLFISLFSAYFAFLFSRYKAKQSLESKMLNTPRNDVEGWLLATVAKQARQAGIPRPQVGIYDSADMNAYASGVSHSMISVSKGLLFFMPRAEAEAVLGHEICHLANMDMPKLIAYQGVLNVGVFYLSVLSSDVVFALFLISSGEILGLMAMLFAVLLFSVLTAALLMRFSRQLEFCADEGGAGLSQRRAMIAALERLSGERYAPLPEKMAVFGIKGSLASGVKRIFMSHPSLDERISLLRRHV
ncbi:zinc metalloprotease HtpX [Iodobacter fluviatilis]|uniref:Heat shock protein HtpX n=1 Tax=Iodobacter fluviatilis TaxID=537 RepID=A0A377Q9A2_9NEIS|nr:zinc metalloprotease HtpX [Iodobacter fluviatilis]TCU87109.1 heat shock protein HtpX [Iodobacter fluviatilis]STQ90441.1 Protease HtpX [Iodobacter fluviatilis]